MILECSCITRVRRSLMLALCLTVACLAASNVSAADAAGSSITFESEIEPLLTRLGCNSGPCHGKSRGQNGFALSLFGFDPDFDFAAIVNEARGRRVFSGAAEKSLLLRKAIGEIPHGGGKRFEAGSQPYEEIRKWIQQGMPRTPADAPELTRVVIEPAHVRLTPKQKFPIRVVAEYSNGNRRDVTEAAGYQTNDRTIAAISSAGDGVIQAGPIPGEAAIMARYLNHIAVCNVTIPLPGDVADAAYDALHRLNKIDELVWQKLKLLGMLPSPSCSDATFHRRAFLRVIGRVPTPEETRAFLADGNPAKRSLLIDQLLDRPEYGDFWANKWADLLRPNPYRTGIKAVWNLDAWIKDAFRKNMPYDQFARELITAQGSTWKNGAAVIFRDRPESIEIASSVSQLFLGVRLECAKCHHHPFEVWSQDDFYGFASFFSRVGHKGEGLSPPISGGEEIIFTRESGSLAHGRTGVPVLPKTLNGETLNLGPDEDPRQVLAAWMTSTSNPYFPRVMANRVWAELMGHGLVDPVDDIRATNPASNEALLDYLATEFQQHGYDIKKLIRTITSSHVFGLSSIPTDRNISDVKNFSRYYRQRMRAEVMLDAVNDILGVEEDFSAMPPGSRAMQLWTYRSSSLFLDTFGRPDLNQDPPCERSSDTTTPQVLHLMNSPALNQKLARDTARPAKLAGSSISNEALLDEAYLLIYCRFPTDAERQAGLQYLPQPDQRRKAVEDLFWALLNTPEFSFID